MNLKAKFLLIVLCTAAIGSFGIANNADAADPAAAPKPENEVAQESTSSTPTVSVFRSCSNPSGTCTATAACPIGSVIKSGWSFYIVPNGVQPAFGICGTASAACVKGTTSCSVTTASSVCTTPGWRNQTALVAIACVASSAD